MLREVGRCNRRVADALPKKRFDAFILLVKLAPFTAEEIAMARSANGRFETRVILLTAKELEPYLFYLRHEDEAIRHRGSFPEDLAEITSLLYFPAGAADAEEGENR